MVSEQIVVVKEELDSGHPPFVAMELVLEEEDPAVASAQIDYSQQEPAVVVVKELDSE